MLVEPYLFFEGRCEEALDFYAQSLGAPTLFKMRYSESPEPHEPGKLKPGMENKLMHASFKVGDSMIMCSDGMAEGKATFQGFGLALQVDSDAEADAKFNALAAGGNVMQPLVKTFFSSKFGMVADKFGVMWMVLVKSEQPSKDCP